MKAKDLQGKNIEDLSEARADALENDSDEPKPSSEATAGRQEDAVAAAYENISKKLESIRSGKNVDEESEDSDESKESKVSDDEPELEEWKGPKPPKKEPNESNESEDLDKEEHELRKVKLHNLEDEDEESSASAKASADEEEEEGEESASAQPSTGLRPAGKASADEKDWEPKDNDPLDEESVDESKAAEGEPRQGREPEEEPVSEAEGPEESRAKDSDESENLDSEIPVKSDDPDTLDDLTGGKEMSASADSSSGPKAEEDEDEYPIPNLKGSRQGANMSYNAPIERESFDKDFSKSRYMDSNDPNNFFSQHSQPSQMPKRANKFHLLILIVIGIAVIGFTIYVLKGGFGDINLGTQPSPSPSPTATPTPTPTPTPEPDRSQYKLRVLNGTGKAGLAASVSAKLKELGYQTEKTGNATNSAFTQTVVRVKPSLESFIPQIVKDLAPDYDAAGNASLKDSDAVDIEVILGAK